MKKIVLSLGILLSGAVVSTVAASTYVMVQAAQGNTESAKRLESIKKACNPSADQITKIQSLLNDFESAKAANAQTNKGNKSAMAEGLKKCTYDFNQKLAKVLTPEQMKALNAADASYSKEKKAEAPAAPKK
jgi:hypothetical protein